MAGEGAKKKSVEEKNDIDKLVEKYSPVLKKLSEDAGKAAKKGEENLLKMSKVLKLQVDIMGGALQREKLYYTIGKEVAAKIKKGTISIDGFEKYTKALKKIDDEETKKKSAMKKVKSEKPASGKKK